MKYVYKIIPGVILFMGLAGACKDDDSTSIPVKFNLPWIIRLTETQRAHQC